jgi:hypothetical protein
MSLKVHRELDTSLFIAHLDRGNVFSQSRKFLIDPALFEEVGGRTVEVHRRSYEE